MVIFSPGCDVRTPDESKPFLPHLCVSPCRWLQSSAQLHPGRRPDGVRSSQQVSVGRGLFPSQALRHEPVSHPRPPAPQQAASPPDSPRRAVRHAIQHAVGRTVSPARLRGSVVPELRHPVGGEHPTATRRHPRGGTFSHGE